VSRNRVIYQSDAVFVGPDAGGATGAHTTGIFATYGKLGTQMSGNDNIDQLYRIQSVAWNASVARQNVNQFGELAAIDQLILEQPTVGLDLTWLVNGLENERAIGLTVKNTGQAGVVSCISGILSKATDEHNFFVVQAAEGSDINNATIQVAGTRVYGFGNMFLSSYSTEGNVGGFPQATTRFEGLNYVVQTGAEQNVVPAVFPTDGTRVTGWFYKLSNPTSSYVDAAQPDLASSAFRPGDITLNIYESGTTTAYTGLGAVSDSVNGALQSYRFNFDLRRENLQKLGSKFAYSKEVTYPLDATCSINGLVRDLNVGSLETIICDDKLYDIQVTIARPTCDTVKPVLAKYILKGAKISNQSYNMNIGSNKTFTLDFTSQIGSATQTSLGMFMSGIN